MIDFEFPCPACRTKSPQGCKKPTLFEPTVGWISCPECKCKIQLRVIFKIDKDNIKKVDLQILHVHRSQRYKDNIAAQKARDQAKVN
jgi:hypothetical protein